MSNSEKTTKIKKGSTKTAITEKKNKKSLMTTLHIHNYQGIADMSIDLPTLFEGILYNDYIVDAASVIRLVQYCLYGEQKKKDNHLIVDSLEDLSTYDTAVSLEIEDAKGNNYQFTRGSDAETHHEFLHVAKNNKTVSSIAIDEFLGLLEDTVEILIHKHLHEVEGIEKIWEEKTHNIDETFDVSDAGKDKKKSNKKTKLSKKKKKMYKKMKKDAEKIKLSEGQNKKLVEKNLKKGYDVTKDTVDNKKVLVYVKRKVVAYEKDLRKLQIELLKYQNHIVKNNKKLMILFEGRDAAGKGGLIKRVTAHLNPRYYNIVALEKPTAVEQSQRYFQRYMAHLPHGGQMTFFDRSRYNRAMVEIVMGFCTEEEHRIFLNDVVNVEDMLVSNNIVLHKIYLSITKEEQQKRLDARREDPLKVYKISPVDDKAVEYRNKYTLATFEMFISTHKTKTPWTIIETDDKKQARLNAIKYILQDAEYQGKTTDTDFLTPNNYVVRSGSEQINIMQEQFKNGLSYFK